VDGGAGAPLSGGDLEYDLAHEAADAVDSPTARHELGAGVPTATPDYDGDYSYDLAHDVPKS
jgi:xanthine/CO dehydrogenase XdhC/CoxF family maturation factor